MWNPIYIELFGALLAGAVVLGFIGSRTRRLLQRQAQLVRLVNEQSQQLAAEIAQREQATDALRASEALYHSVWESASDALRLTDEQGIIVAVNQAYCRLIGRERDELIGQPFTVAYADGGDSAAVQARYRSRFRAGSVRQHEERRVILRNDQERDLEVTSSFVATPTRPGLLLGLFRDMTGRKRMEDDLERERNLLRLLTDNIPDCVYVKDTEGAYVLNNRAHLQHLGVETQAQTLGKTIGDFMPADPAESLHAVDLQVLQSGESVHDQEEHGRDALGREYWRLITKIPLRQSAGRIFGLLGVSREITGRKRAEQALAYERDLFSTLLENVPEHVYFKDRQSRFVKFSRSLLTDLGLSDPAELAGKTDFDFFTEGGAGAFHEDELRIMHTGEPMIGVIEEESHHNGKTTWAMTTKMPWRDSDGQIIGTFGVSRDITALKLAEQQIEATHRQLLEASHQAGMAEVAAGVLHNVGNVLNSINVSANLVATRLHQSKVASLQRLSALLTEHRENLAAFLTEDPKGRQVPDYISQLAGHLAAEQAFMAQEIAGLQKNIEHVKDIVAMQQGYARLSGVKESVDVTDLTEDALQLNAGALTRHEVRVTREYEQVPKITIERHKVLQILVNLVRNAKYACDESGRPDRWLTVQVQRADDRLRIRVRDNGVGIPPENLTRIFNHGFTTRKEGHGFGLHSAALAAKELGGWLSVHSDGPGQGATFTLELPLTDPADPAL